jgi:hypothetical protein
MPLKIKIQERDGEQHIDPETMDLLVGFSHHPQFCELCENASKGNGKICSLGEPLILQLLRRPDVEFVPDEKLPGASQ